MPRDSSNERDRPRDRDRERRHRERDAERRERRRGTDTEGERERARDRRKERARDSDREPEQTRPRKGHKYSDSTNALLPKDGHASDSPSPVKDSHRRRRRESDSTPKRWHGSTDPSSRSTSKGGLLSADALGKLDKQNYKKGWGTRDEGNDGAYLEEVRVKEEALEKDRKREEREQRRKEKHERRRADLEEEDLRRREEGERQRIRELEEKQQRQREEREQIRAERERKKQAHNTYDDLGIRVRPMVSGDERGEDGRERRRKRNYTESEIEERDERRRRRREKEDRKRRVVSGPLLEEGGRHDSYEVAEKRGGAGSSEYQYMSPEEEERARKKKKSIIIAVIIVLVLLAIMIPVAVVVSRRNSDSDGGGGGSGGGSSSPQNSELDDISQDDIPTSAKGGLLDPFTWYDTTDMNVTYTEETVGGLSVMGLFSSWDDKVQANDRVPGLEDSFEYGKMPIRGMNVGGWLNIEPFITPSFFAAFGSRDGVIDEWTLTAKMGPGKAASKLEEHYSTFITKKTFSDIRVAGFDHVRIPFGYWAVTTYEGDPYVPKIAWRYLLRGIEYCRQNGLRVKLDVHGLPGSQNGWNHSGRQGPIGWLNGTDGDLNAQRSLDMHDQLSQFFAQPRYKNLVTMYGLANEPRMVDLNTDSVLAWTDKAIELVRGNGITAIIVFGDGFMGLDKWQGRLQNHQDLLLDVHQYVIFNVDQLSLNHEDKLNFACQGWTQQSQRSMDRTTGFGPTMCGEWSQADTDCTPNLNNVGWGTRWEGTYNTGNTTTSVLKPQCPASSNERCSCDKANADPKDYSDAYKQWLLLFAQAQMYSFEQGWGWFYWTWETEKATQWSYRRGMEAGILPKKAWERSWVCGEDTVPDFGGMGLEEFY